jgi:hypothetical protein
MANTTFSGPVRAGTIRDGASANVGSVVLAQTATLTFDATLVQTVSFQLPAGAQILDIYADPLVVFDSATSATLSVGTAAAGTQYAGSLDVKTAGRKRMTLTAAIATSMANIGTTTGVFFTVTSVGQPTAGSLTCVVQYKQN